MWKNVQVFFDQFYFWLLNWCYKGRLKCHDDSWSLIIFFPLAYASWPLLQITSPTQDASTLIQGIFIYCEEDVETLSSSSPIVYSFVYFSEVSFDTKL